MTWFPSYREPPEPSMSTTPSGDDRVVGGLGGRSNPPSPFDEQVQRSLLVLRALTHEDTGGIVAAATTSLPEEEGGVRNWDYRYVWLRDAALTIEVLITHGYRAEAEEWRGWLLRAIAGDPADVQIMYGIGGERRLPEYELPELAGYGGAAPVRVGNAAYLQRQWDIFGEVMIALHGARTAGLEETRASWPLQRALLGFLEDELGSARPRDLGDPRRRAALHPLAGDGVGRVRPRRARHRGIRAAGRSIEVGGSARPRP